MPKLFSNIKLEIEELTREYQYLLLLNDQKDVFQEKAKSSEIVIDRKLMDGILNPPYKSLSLYVDGKRKHQVGFAFCKTRPICKKKRGKIVIIKYYYVSVYRFGDFELVICKQDKIYRFKIFHNDKDILGGELIPRGGALKVDKKYSVFDVITKLSLDRSYRSLPSLDRVLSYEEFEKHKTCFIEIMAYRALYYLLLPLEKGHSPF